MSFIMGQTPDATRHLKWCTLLLLMALHWIAPAGALADEAAEYPFKFETVAHGGKWEVVAHNRGPAPVEIALSLATGVNISSDHSWPVVTLVPGNASTTVVSVTRADKHAPARFSYRYTYRIGDPGAQPDPKAVYRLPFENGYFFQITQAPDGPLVTHDDPGSRYAVDIAMPIGTTVVAARAGYVLDVVKGFKEGKNQSAYRNKANLVRILHDDGTWAIYAHLSTYLPNIHPGQRIEAGAPIGLSGSSGYSSGPHLHFAVQKNGGDEDISLPFKFYMLGRGEFSPHYGDWVEADYGMGAASAPTLSKPAMEHGASPGSVGDLAPHRAR